MTALVASLLTRLQSLPATRIICGHYEGFLESSNLSRGGLVSGSRCDWSFVPVGLLNLAFGRSPTSELDKVVRGRFQIL